MRILVQVGFKKSSTQIQMVKAFVHGEEISWNNTEGKYLTALAERKRNIWYLASLDLVPGVVIQMEVFTGLYGLGQDEDRTRTILFRVDDDQEVKEFSLSKVGYSGAPLLKGKVEEVANVSKEDERRVEISGFLEEGFENE